jgi:hypothetical protein
LARPRREARLQQSPALEVLDAAAAAGVTIAMVRMEQGQMPLTHDFKETIRSRVQSDTDFRRALLREAVECLINGDLTVGKSVLRDYIHAIVGFQPPIFPAS